MGAMAFGIPEMEISEKEAQELAKALTAVQEQYNAAIDPKYLVLLNMTATAGIIYIPRFYLFRERIRYERAKQVNDVPQEKQRQNPETGTAETHDNITDIFNRPPPVDEKR